MRMSEKFNVGSRPLPDANLHQYCSYISVSASPRRTTSPLQVSTLRGHFISTVNEHDNICIVELNLRATLLPVVLV